jgi:hypothetical protein
MSALEGIAITKWLQYHPERQRRIQHERSDVRGPHGSGAKATDSRRLTRRWILRCAQDDMPASLWWLVTFLIALATVCVAARLIAPGRARHAQRSAINRAATHKLLYRLWQGFQQLGAVRPLSKEEYAEVATRLPTGALQLFQTMSPADQRHSLRVYQGLLARGCTEADMLAAALLHDVGKAGARVPFWTRPAIVIGKLCLPRLLAWLALPPALLGERIVPRWQRALSFAWWHAEIGAELAAAAGLSARSVLYIRTHHQPHGPAAALHAADEVS